MIDNNRSSFLPIFAWERVARATHRGYNPLLRCFIHKQNVGARCTRDYVAAYTSKMWERVACFSRAVPARATHRGYNPLLRCCIHKQNVGARCTRDYGNSLLNHSDTLLKLSSIVFDFPPRLPRAGTRAAANVSRCAHLSSPTPVENCGP